MSKINVTESYSQSLFIVTKKKKKYKQPKYPSADKCITKLWYIHIIEYCLAKTNKIWTHTSAWINLEKNYPSENRHSQKTTYCIHIKCPEWQIY